MAVSRPSLVAQGRLGPGGTLDGDGFDDGVLLDERYLPGHARDDSEQIAGVSIRVEKLDKLVMDVVEQRVLSAENVERFVGETLTNLHDAPTDGVADDCG